MADRIAIIGSHHATRGRAPYAADAGWEIWGCSPKNQGELPRHDAWFEIHEPAYVRSTWPEYFDWLSRQPELHVFDAAKWPPWPGVVDYPRKAMLEQFGPYFFSCSVSWMWARAIARKPRAIGIWGVEAASATEAAYQRPSHHHFAQIADDLGIEIVIDPSSHLLDPPQLYPDPAAAVAA